MAVTKVGPRAYMNNERQRAFGRAALFAVFVWAGAPAPAVDHQEVPARFLIVYEQDSALAANIQTAAGIKAVLARAIQDREVYSEHLDMARFPDPAHAERLADDMAAKYRDRRMTAVLVAGESALKFVLRNRNAFAPGAPVVFGRVTRDTAEDLDLPPDVRGVLSRFDARGTVDLARRLQPDAGRIVVVTGSAPYDRIWQETARADLSYNHEIKVDFVSDLSLAGFARMAAELDRYTILLILTVFEDADARTFIPRDAAAIIAEASAAPAYGVYSSFIGAGVLGGYVESFQSIGEAMAEMAIETMAGTPGPALVDTVPEPVGDWRQMLRFGIDPVLLPPNTRRLFYEPTPWERYKLQILLAAAVILLQSATISALLVQERRRRRMAGELATERIELAHLSRTVQLGALSGALAHELNQPLASILANAQAGSQLLGQEPLDLAEMGAIFADIADDDRRAAEIIVQLRRLMVKGDTALEPVDLNQVVNATVALTRSEMLARQTQVEVHPTQAELIARGNFAQLQQVLLNLMLNAAEAMAELPATRRRIRVQTKLRHDSARELVVTDSGPGLLSEMETKAFTPFVSSKPNGLGLGLAICRTIARAHGGTLAFDDRATGGARIVLTLPASAL
jgi:signal transduction histidine kinase